MNAFIEFMVDLGLNAGNGKLNAIKEQMEIRIILQSFIEKQAKINEYCTLAEEIDFQGLADYISGNLLEDIKIYLFREQEERKEATEEIIRKAIYYSQANNKQSSDKVTKLVCFVLDILREYYRSHHVDQSTLLVANEIIDTVESMMHKSDECIINDVSSKIDSITSDNILSIDRNLQLIKNGNIDKVEENLYSFINSISSEHVLYPDYRYVPEMKHGKNRFLSQPTTTDAVIKYPPKMECKTTIRMGNQYLNEFNDDIKSYADRHQLPIFINIKEAKKLLGDIYDPIQYEADEIIGKDFVIPPKPFPDALPYSILIDGNIEFEYILLKTEEILEDGTFIISNKEQVKCPFRICIKIHIIENKTDFDIRTENANNNDILKYVRLMNKISSGVQIIIRALSLGENFLEGNLSYSHYKSDFNSISEEIDFLERVVNIENYFKTTMNLPEEIIADDYEAIYYMSRLISGEECSGNWSDLSFSFTLNDIIKNKITEMEDSRYSVAYIADTNISLYGEEYCFAIRRTHKIVQVKDLERLKKKADALDVGDTIKIDYIPGEEDGTGSFIDTLYTEPPEVNLEAGGKL